MQRIFAILSIFVLVFTQMLPTVNIAVAEASSKNFKVEATSDSTQEQAIVTVNTLTSDRYDTVKVSLPENAKFNKKQTEAIEQQATEIIYSNKQHTLSIEWEGESEQKAQFVVDDLPSLENTLKVEGIIDNEVVANEKIDFLVAGVEKAELNESTEKDETSEDNSESKEEKQESDDKAESTEKDETSEDNSESKEEKQESDDKAESTEKDETSEDNSESKEEKQESDDKAESTEKDETSEDNSESKEEKQESDDKAESTEKDETSEDNSESKEEKQESDDKAESTEKDETSEDNSESKEEKQGSDKKLKDVTKDEESTGDLNTYVGIGPVFDKTLSGSDADFRLTLKLTGSKRTYKNVDVIIDLPLSEYVTFDDSEGNLDHLAIDGVSPTFDSDESQLIYHFDEIKRGQMYEKIISLNTKNGYIKNNTSLEVEASITGEVHYTENDEKEEAEKGDVVPFEYEDRGSMDITASGALSLSKFQVDENEINQTNSTVVNRGDEVRWKLELEIPKKQRGQLFLNPDEKITITDTLPDELEYIEVTKGDEPTSVEGQTLAWEFDAEDFEAQEEKGKSLYKQEIVIQTKVKDNAAKGDVKNTAEATATFIENSQVSDQASRTVVVAVDNPSTGDIEGAIYVPSHFGPGGSGDNKNPNQSVTDDTILEFRHAISPLRESFPDGYNGGEGKIKDFQSYKTIYDIDRNLNLEVLVPPSHFQFRPTNQTDPYLLAKQPKFDIIAEFYDGVPSRTLVSAEDLILKKEYDREELGLASDEKVKTIIYDFGKMPGGTNAGNFAKYKFSIDKGFRGEVENKFNVVGVDGNGKSFDHRKKYPEYYTNGNEKDLAGPRQTTVVGYGENPEPVGRVGVKLLEDVNGVVTLGKNRMQVELINVNNSGAPMNSQLETVVLLAPGVTLHDEVNPSYTNAQGDPTDGASYEVLDENYNGSGRQLVKVKWDEGRITKGQNLTAELDVYIAEEAPNQLQFDVYGFSNDEGLKAPSNTEGGVTDTVLQADSENFYGNGEEHPRLKSGNIYSLAGKYDVQTEKLIKGPNDEDYSKFTTAPFEGSVDYKLKLTNTTGKDLSMMTLIDVLPTVGDLGITDNVNRGSTFDPILEGPITLPAEWQGKVNVFYSTAKNPERDELTRHTDYLPNTPQLTNPEGAEAPNWMQESDVADWSTIHSFKIELQKGDTWIKGQDIEIDFSMIMPEESDVEDEVKNLDIVPQQRAAWNSFAVATDTGQAVEPERVGVALELDPPETPDVEKEVEDNDGDYGKDLVEKEREKDYNYHVNTVVPEDLRGYEYITLADDLDERLDVIGAAALVDGKEVDYDVVIDGQLVTLKVDREQLDEIAGQELTLQITAQIKGDVEVEVIDNQATIQVNDNPSEDSNIVPVEPPQPPTPDVEKEVEDNDGDYGKDLVEKEREKNYNYRVNTVVPENLVGYEHITLADDLDERLDVIEAVALVDGKEVDYDVVIDGQLVTLKVDRKQLDEIAGKELTLQITAQIKGDVEVEVIDNQATIQVNDNPTEDSNIVPVEPPQPPTPDVEKEVEDNDGDYGKDLVEKEREKDYNYRVNTVVPEDLVGYEHITLADDLDKRLDVIEAVALVDGKEVDYDVVIDGQLVTLKVDREQLDEIAGQELTLQITAQIKGDVEVEVIDNQATIQVNDNPTEDSNIVPVEPPQPPTPDVEKEVEDNDGDYGKDLVEKEREKDYNYRVNTVVPESLLGYEYITLADELDERLEVKGAVALVDGEEVDYEVEIKDQLVTLKVDREQLDEIAGQELTLQITAQIKDGVEVEVIDNEASIQVNDNPKKDSNIVPVTPPEDPPTKPEINKDVEGTNHLDIDYDKEYNYNVLTTLPSNIEEYEKFIVTDKVDDGLVVNADKVKATVDGKAYDGLKLTVKGNDVKVEVTDFAGLKGSDQLELIIPAKIHPDTNMDDYKDNKIPNTADLDFTNESGEEDKKTTKPVTVTPPPPEDPPTKPEINKDVEGTNHLDIDYDKEYNYNVLTTLPSNIEEYEKFIVTDKVDDGLVVNADKVKATVDGKAYDGLKLTVKGNDVKVEVTDFAGLKGSDQLELIIPAKIHPDTNMDDYKDNKIPNTADLDFTNESGEEDKKTTKPVTVTPPEDPPTKPESDKDVEDTDEPGMVTPPSDPEEPTTSDKSGEKLPITATDNFNMILIGVLMLIAGTGFMVFRKKIKN